MAYNGAIPALRLQAFPRTRKMMDAPTKTRYQREFDAHCHANRLAEAAAMCEELAGSQKDSIETLLLVGQFWQRIGNFDAMLHVARQAYALDRTNPALWLRLAECEIYCGQIGNALNRLAENEALSANDDTILQMIAQMYLHCAAHEAAARCYQRSLELKPDNAGYLYNLAASSVILGDIAGAEALFNRAIDLAPGMFDAYLGRSNLKKWATATHHIAQLTQILGRLPDTHPGQVPLCYALAKEYEDIGDPRQSIAFLQHGASRRRAKLAYRVETDVNAMQRIRQTFDGGFFSKAEAAGGNAPAYFILGLPRSGTTLVDRILSSHSLVASLGEVQSFTFALMRLAGAGADGKLGLIERSARIDFARLGELYRSSIVQFGRSEPHLINKTPANYLYLGLIHRALPKAKIIHVRRHPLDSCYAMYKTLFNMGYPFSYSLTDIGHYYLAYHELMQHWRTHIPDSFLDVDYEALVDRQEQTTRAMLGYCGLAWEQGCIDFHNNAAPAASASASQVRQPVYKSSVHRWRDYADELAPLVAFLTDHGIHCE
jgi:tetratricopeptide (TPR) repeat protein